MKQILPILLYIMCCNLGFAQTIKEKNSILIPLSANAYLVDVPASQKDGISSSGINKWNGTNQYAVFFSTQEAAKVDISLQLHASTDCKLKISIGKKTYFKSIKTANGQQNNELQTIHIPNVQLVKGYQHIKIEGASNFPLADQNNSKSINYYPSIETLVITSFLPESSITYVPKSFSAHFGRRGPSCHLKYNFTDTEPVEWFYNEITVSQGNDVIGSYFMANGFGEGYFGMQVNSENERRILFSVWSPFTTDNPKEIPESHKIHLLRKGPGVKTGEFGNEGSGGQSYLVHNWKAGLTYKFLNRVKPIDETHTLYTAYFYDVEKAEWLLIASFIRPQTHTWYKGAYSFLENFIPNQGQFVRRVHFSNQWFCTAAGKWVEVNNAQFTADATARAKARTDYQGGVENNLFYLQNCGFFNETTTIGHQLTRNKDGKQPQIDFKALP